MKTAPVTYKIHHLKTKLRPGEVQWNKLVQDINRGYKFFWDARPHLHAPTYETSFGKKIEQKESNI